MDPSWRMVADIPILERINLQESSLDAVDLFVLDDHLIGGSNWDLDSSSVWSWSVSKKRFLLLIETSWCGGDEHIVLGDHTRFSWGWLTLVLRKTLTFHRSLLVEIRWCYLEVPLWSSGCLCLYENSDHPRMLALWQPLSCPSCVASWFPCYHLPWFF